MAKTVRRQAAGSVIGETFVPKARRTWNYSKASIFLPVIVTGDENKSTNQHLNIRISVL